MRVSVLALGLTLLLPNIASAEIRPLPRPTSEEPVASLADQLSNITFAQAAPDPVATIRRPVMRPDRNVPIAAAGPDVSDLSKELSGISFVQAAPDPVVVKVPELAEAGLGLQRPTMRPQPRDVSVTEVASLSESLSNIEFTQSSATLEDLTDGNPRLARLNPIGTHRPMRRPHPEGPSEAELARLEKEATTGLSKDLTGIQFTQSDTDSDFDDMTEGNRLLARLNPIGTHRPRQRPHPEGPSDAELAALAQEKSEDPTSALSEGLSEIEFTQSQGAYQPQGFETRVTRGTLQAPIQSTRPVMRGGALADGVLEAIGIANQNEVQRSQAPVITPSPLAGSIAQVTVASAMVAGVPRSGRPQMRPEVVLARVREEANGLICGSHAIKGRRIAPIPGTMAGCGVQNPVKIEAIAGVAFKPAVTLNCATARSLETWINRGVHPAVGNYGGGVVSMYSPSHYSCRTRNGQPGAKLSEHAKGNAIDITHMTLRNGTKITLLDGWNGPRKHRRILRTLHKAACGPFGTVLGPESNRFHRDHFHFDVARYTSGPYCR